MWMDEDGVTHTVAVPDWASVVDVRVIGRSVEPALTPDEVGAVEETLEALEEQFFDEVQQHGFDEGVEAHYVEAVPDRLVIQLVGTNPASVAASLADQVGALPLRWRYDYIEALQDFLLAGQGHGSASGD